MLYYVKDKNGDLFLFSADNLFDLAEQVEREIGISEKISYEELGDYTCPLKIDMKFHQDEIIFSEKDKKYFTQEDVVKAQAWQDRLN